MRKIIAALFALCSTLAAAQAPSPVPALPDAPRITQYSISGTACACAVNFALYGDGVDVDNWLQVFIGSTQYLSSDPVNGWTITSPSGSIGNIARPITDAVLTFNQAQTGTVTILGARRPRRLTQFQENRGVAARDLNQAITDEIAQLREGWDKTDRAILGQPGETLNLLPPASSRVGGVLAFDPATGQPIIQPNVPSGSIPAGSITGSLIASGTVANSNLSNMAAGTAKCRPLGASTGVPEDCSYRIISITDAPYSADPTGVADSTTAIQNAINALPVNGGIVQFPPGNYKISSTLTVGNGSSSVASTRYGVILQAACGITIPFFNGFPSTPCAELTWAGGASDMIHVLGPLQGWGIQGLFLNGASTANSCIHVTSAQFGDSANLSLNNCLHGLASDTVPIFGALSNTDSYYNSYRNLAVQVPNIANAIGILIDGNGSNNTSNTDFNSFYGVNVSIPNASGTVQAAIDLKACDSNVFYDTKVFLNSVNSVGVQFDYSAVNSWPASNTFVNLDSSGTTGAFINNSSTPGSSARPNYIIGLVETNGFSAPNNFANLAVYSSHNINLNQGGNNPSTQLQATNGHLGYTGNSTPTLTGGCNGAGSSVTGTDNAGIVQGQTAAATSCVLTFAHAYAAPPVCMLIGNTAPLTGTNNNSNTAITVNFAAAANFFWSYICFGN